MLNMLQTTRKIPNIGGLGDTPDYGNEPDTTVQSNSTPPIVGSSSGGIDSGDWFSLLQQGLNKIAVPILNSQFGGPQPGQFFSTNAKTGQAVAYNLPQGSSSVNTFGTGFGTSFSTSGALPILLIGGAALILFSMMGRSK